MSASAATWIAASSSGAAEPSGRDSGRAIAAVRPVDVAARLLVGAGEPLPAVVYSWHRRPLELSLELPDGELEAAIASDQFDEILDSLSAHVVEHRTTLVFVNTRKLSERVAHQLGERLGQELVAAHHGSLSRERRQRVEHRLRAGDLRALVATASLELGIDMGAVDLVCQVESPGSVARGLQRVGRAGHLVGRTSKGRLLAKTPSEAGAQVAGLRVLLPQYAAPEQIDRQLGEPGPWTDVYSLGAVLYECLVGEPPPPTPSGLWRSGAASGGGPSDSGVHRAAKLISPAWKAVISRAIGNDMPASAAAPSGHSLRRLRASLNRPASRASIST